ncbi:hypothetical protein VTK56DRAFT_4835 [Thermocarpiscus australiensis]
MFQNPATEPLAGDAAPGPAPPGGSALERSAPAVDPDPGSRRPSFSSRYYSSTGYYSYMSAENDQRPEPATRTGSRSLQGIFLRMYFYVLSYRFVGLLLWLLGDESVLLMQAQVLYVDNPQTALDFRAAVKDESSMIAVAGTILAQVAITALSLDDMRRVHWTARGFLLFSLASSIISVYYAVRQYRTFSRFLEPADIRRWIRRNRKFTRAGPAEQHGDLLPSAASVLTVSAPSALLSASAYSFLAGMGIYLLFVWIWELDEVAGQGDSKAIFITYVVAVGVCYLLYYVSGLLVSNSHLLSEAILDSLKGTGTWATGASEFRRTRSQVWDGERA